MKKIIYVLISIFCLGLTSCSNNTKTENKETVTTQFAKEAKSVYEIVSDAENNLDKEVYIKGLVKHTCKHSGKRCFLTDTISKTSIRVEAGGNISGFNKELIGSEIIIKGVLKGKKYEKEYILKMQQEIKEKKLKEDGSAQKCGAELNNLISMLKWMEENNKDYYQQLYVESIDFETVE